MRKLQLTILFLFSCLIVVSAQNATTANRLFEDGDYKAAQQAYKSLLRSNPRSPLYLYRYARCAQQQGDYNTAIEYFNRAGDKYPLKYFYLGDMYMHLWHFDDAIRSYQTYMQSLSTPNERVPYIQQQIRDAEKKQRYLKRVEKVHIIDSVEVPIDSMLYVCVLSAEAGTLTRNDIGGITYTNQRGDRRLWSVSQDSALLLVSAHRLLDQWSQPDTLPSVINRSDKQISPYVLSDGVTLYFASNDTNGLGGYDIYVSRYNTATETYTHPENMGYPYNSEANEYLMVIDETRHVGYFATDRFSQTGYVRVYSFVPTEQKTYWRGLQQDSLVAYAQLRNCLSADSVLRIEVETPTSVLHTEARAQEPQIYFVLNDTMVYTSVDDFHSTEARKAFDEWQRLQQQMQAEHTRLDSLRREYNTATPEKRKEITPAILHIESKQNDYTKQANNLLNTVRREELNERK